MKIVLLLLPAVISLYTTPYFIGYDNEIIIIIKRMFIQDRHFNNYNIAVTNVCPVP